MKAFADRLDRFVTFVGMAGGWLLFLLAAVVCFDVTTRKFFVFQSTLMQEMEWHIHTVIFFLALGMAYLRGSHVRIDIFRDKMSERARQAGTLRHAVSDAAVHLPAVYVRH